MSEKQPEVQCVCLWAMGVGSNLDRKVGGHADTSDGDHMQCKDQTENSMAEEG
jgi:hypothetical protein